jgi:hypothetical protein
VTSPPVQVLLVCPACGETYLGWYRPSINTWLEDWSDAEIAEATSARCPACGHRTPLEAMVFDRGDRATPATNRPEPRTTSGGAAATQAANRRTE